MSRLSAIILGTTIALVQPTIAWAQDVYDIAKEITVFIDGCSSGSGVIYDKKGNTYYVLTAYHVVDENPRFCRVITTDGESYDPGPDNIEHIGSLDLAVVKFVSNKRYQVGTLGDSQSITIGKTVYIAGAPPSNPILEMERTIRVSEGKIIGRASQASEGYTLIYDNTTRGGMSGGPILNTEGEIIGIHGKGDLKDGSKENYGIPIEKFQKARGSSFGKRPSPPDRTDARDESSGNGGEGLSLPLILLGGLAILGGGAGLLSLGYLFGSRTQGKNKTKVSYSPPRLAYPERFAVIRCADRDAYQNIDRRIDSLGIKQRQVIRLSEDKNLTDDGDASSQNLETSAQNLSVPYDDIRRLLTKVTKNSGEKNFRESSEEKIREMLNYLQTYPIDIWKDCLDRQTLNLSQSQAKPAPSSVNYRALAAMLVPSQVPEWLHWLKNLPNQKIAKDSLAFQEQFLEASRSSGRGYKKLKSLVQAGISELLCELIDNISQQNYQDIEWLLVIQENHNIWHSRFNSYADKLLDKLAILMSPEKTSEEDEFYRKLSVTFKEMEATQWRFKKGNYDKIAELVQKYEKYELSAIFFQISRGYVPRKVYDRFQRGGIGDIPFVPERSLWVWDKIQQRVLPKLLIIFGMFGTIAIGAISVYLIYEYEEKIPEFESLSLLGKAKITLSDDLKRYENASEEERSQIKEEIMKYLKVADRRNEIYIQIKDSLMPDTLPYAELLDIKSNKKKVEVVILQQILTRAGVYNGPITGYFGDRTKEAIQEYQRSEGIIADGEVTYETWFSMSRILRDAQVELVYNFLVKSFEKDQGEEARESLARCKNNGEKALYFGNCVQKLIDEL